jgi:hypothetical protein
MDGSNRGAPKSDALVLFGVSGDSAHRKILTPAHQPPARADQPGFATAWRGS